MKLKCLCLMVVFAETLGHACGVHLGLEAFFPVAMNHLNTVDE